MTTKERIRTYREFWPFYVGEHLNATSRKLHFVGSGLALVSLGLGVISSPWFFAAAPVCGYSFAWAGHFFFEKNRPATFKYPFWSLLSDFRMFGLMSMGRMGAEVARHGKNVATVSRSASGAREAPFSRRP